MSPKKAKELQADATVSMPDGGLAQGEPMLRAELYHALGKAHALARQLETLKGESPISALANVRDLAAALARTTEIEPYEQSASLTRANQNRVKKALTQWEEYSHRIVARAKLEREMAKVLSPQMLKPLK